MLFEAKRNIRFHLRFTYSHTKQKKVCVYSFNGSISFQTFKCIRQYFKWWCYHFVVRRRRSRRPIFMNLWYNRTRLKPHQLYKNLGGKIGVTKQQQQQQPQPQLCVFTMWKLREMIAWTNVAGQSYKRSHPANGHTKTK